MLLPLCIESSSSPLPERLLSIIADGLVVDLIWSPEPSSPAISWSIEGVFVITALPWPLGGLLVVFMPEPPSPDASWSTGPVVLGVIDVVCKLPLPDNSWSIGGDDDDGGGGLWSPDWSPDISWSIGGLLVICGADPSSPDPSPVIIAVNVSDVGSTPDPDPDSMTEACLVGKISVKNKET